MLAIDVRDCDIVVAMPHRHGGVARMLMALENAELGVSRIEPQSRPDWDVPPDSEGQPTSGSDDPGRIGLQRRLSAWRGVGVVPGVTRDARGP